MKKNHVAVIDIYQIVSTANMCCLACRSKTTLIFATYSQAKIGIYWRQWQLTLNHDDHQIPEGGNKREMARYILFIFHYTQSLAPFLGLAKIRMNQIHST
jgi:hypothetical protein